MACKVAVFCAVFATLLPALGANPSPAPGAVIDRVVALVEGEVLTQSELEFEARVALIQRGGVAAAVAPLDAPAMQGALELAIAQRLAVREAEQLQIYPLEPAEVETAIAAFKARFETEVAFQRFLASQEADVQQLGSVLARALRANRLLDSKVRLRAQVSDAELRRYFDAHKDEFGGAGYDDARPALKERLQRERYAQIAQLELQKLRRAANVRLIAPFARVRDGR